jgi:hypothetical protein
MRRTLRLFGIGVALLLTSCAISRPTVTQLALSDPPLFLVSYPLRYSTNDGRYQIVVPVGFVTDLASIPKALWWWQSPHETTMAPAIIHDYLYWEQSCTKDEADAVMYLSMEELLVKGIEGIYLGIRTPIAKAAWKQNEEARMKGETRFFTQSYAERLIRGNADPKATWVTIQSDAMKSSGLYRPPLPNPDVKQACVAALAYFRTRGKPFSEPGDS